MANELHDAILAGDRAGLQQALEAGADVNAYPEPIGRHGYQMTPLFHALLKGELELAGALLDAGADPNLEELERDAHDIPTLPLALAVSGRQPKVQAWDSELSEKIRLVPRLLEAGADPNALDATGLSAFHRAVQIDKPETVEALLAGGANPDLPTADEWTNDNRKPGVHAFALATPANASAIHIYQATRRAEHLEAALAKSETENATLREQRDGLKNALGSLLADDAQPAPAKARPRF